MRSIQNLHRKTVVFALLAGLTFTSIGCGSDDGGECDECETTSDCDDGLTCRDTTLGRRCLEGSSCEVTFGFLRSGESTDLTEPSEEASCRPCETDLDCSAGETCELTTGDSYACSVPGQVGCSIAPEVVD